MTLDQFREMSKGWPGDAVLVVEKEEFVDFYRELNPPGLCDGIVEACG